MRVRSLRRRVLAAITGVAVLAVLLFAGPLAVAVERLYRDSAADVLERDATWIAAALAVHVQPTAVPGVDVGVYAADGRRISGAGPARSGLATGDQDSGVEDGSLAAVAPIPDTSGPVRVVRAARPYDEVTDQVRFAWLVMGGLALLVIGLAVAFALRQSARLAAPLEHLTRSAQELGDGDFTIRALRSDVREADAAGQALEATARRLGDVLDRERAFSANVSHQLRTQLTGMLLGLEAALARPDADLAEAIRTAVARGEHLQSVIDDLVRLARDSRTGSDPLDVPALLEEARAAWAGTLAAQGRQLTVTLPGELPTVAASPAAIRQILRVLLDNATVHGKGDVSIDVADLVDGIAIEVADQGPGVPEGTDVFARKPADGHGIGLALARSLAEAEAGRLMLRRPAPPVFSLLLPPAARNGSRDPAPS